MKRQHQKSISDFFKSKQTKSDKAMNVPLTASVGASTVASAENPKLLLMLPLLSGSKTVWHCVQELQSGIKEVISVWEWVFVYVHHTSQFLNTQRWVIYCVSMVVKLPTSPSSCLVTMAHGPCHSTVPIALTNTSHAERSKRTCSVHVRRSEMNCRVGILNSCRYCPHHDQRCQAYIFSLGSVEPHYAHIFDASWQLQTPGDGLTLNLLWNIFWHKIQL